MKKALGEVTAGTDFVHVSLDLDAVDPSVTPGVGTPVKGGLAYREAHLIMEVIADAGVMTSLEVVEVNPSWMRATLRPSSPWSWSSRPSERRSFRTAGNLRGVSHCGGRCVL